jgi:hypothetical protein
VYRAAGGALQRCVLAYDHLFTNRYSGEGGRVLPEILCRGGAMAAFDAAGNVTMCLLAQQRVFRNQYAAPAGAGAKPAWSLETPCEAAGLLMLDGAGNVSLCVLARDREFQNIYSLDAVVRVPCAGGEAVMFNARGDVAACTLSRGMEGCRAGELVNLDSQGRVRCGGLLPLPVPTSF